MKRGLFFLFFLIIIVTAVLAVAFVFEINRVIAFDDEQIQEKELVVEKGQGLKQISQTLFDENLVRSRFVFETYVWLLGHQADLQAGNYVVTPMNIRDLTEMLVSGKVDNEIQVKVIEGWTMKDVAVYLDKQELFFSGNDYLKQADVANFKDSYGFLADSRVESLEGFLFPDTYMVYKDGEAVDLINKQLDNFEEKLTPALMTEIRAQGRSLYDVIKMASIIEMEVPNDDERKIVAGILWKRLDENMLLQVDASLKYAIGKKNRNILTFEELEIDSPYNSYKYQGLPPTPICNPGESAMRAAIYPKPSDYWFYLSDDKGTTHFGKTLDEHNANIEKYLR